MSLDAKYPKIYASSQNVESPLFRFATYNVNQGMTTTADVGKSWNERQESVFQTIIDMNADVLCLQELRELPGTENPLAWVARLAAKMNYDFYFQKRNPQPMSFGQVILWKADKFFAVDRRVRWLHFAERMRQVPTDFGGLYACPIMTMVRLAFLNKERKIYAHAYQEESFWVCNVHMPIKADHKDDALNTIVFFLRCCLADEPTILAGDFNLFPDDGGYERRDAFIQDLDRIDTYMFSKEDDWVDEGAAGHLYNARRDAGVVEGTFVGYESDPFKSPVTEDDQGQKVIVPRSRLDLILSRGFERIKTSAPGTKKEISMLLYDGPEGGPAPSLDSRDYPSDHYPGFVDFLYAFN